MRSQLIAVACLAEIPFLVCCHRDPLARYGAVDRVYIEKAIHIYSRRPPAEVLRMFDPAVVYLPKMVCVGMNPRRGVLGGSGTICFDKDGRDILHFRSGD
jgi:hypothetical protein